jgi:hypothetical protein
VAPPSNKVVGEFMEWHALNLLKYYNAFYHYTIATQGLPRHSFKQCLQFEVTCLKLCLLDVSIDKMTFWMQVQPCLIANVCLFLTHLMPIDLKLTFLILK